MRRACLRFEHDKREELPLLRSTNNKNICNQLEMKKFANLKVGTVSLSVNEAVSSCSCRLIRDCMPNKPSFSYTPGNLSFENMSEQDETRNEELLRNEIVN